ncbi:enoyl-CoA hydratase/isomerase family protein [uncultured Mycobacterium sp.]|uniref:enoyl-CoA hydratase/isomerase family protein n=1 Tax=uncultured Mycobacterium sp. TaxID=171292 RepID=UPI0035CC1CB6
MIVDEAEPGIVIVTMNRPHKLNALGMGMVAEMHEAFNDLGASRHVRAVVLTGAGRGFSAGADLTDDDHVAQLDVDDVSAMFALQERLASLHEKIHRLRPPVIAAVNGVAVGGGFSLSLASDIRLASRGAQFGAVFITLGISACDMGTSYFLPRLVGASRAAELMLTGRVFGAEEAKDMGLVIDVVDEGTVVDRALGTCRRIAKNSPMAVWMSKETMWQNIDAPSLRHALDLENRTQIMCSQTGDIHEAVSAFADKRQPTWKPLR